MRIIDTFKSKWNLFKSPWVVDKRRVAEYMGGYGVYAPERRRTPISNERVFIEAPLSRMAVDVASLEFEEIMVNSDGEYESTLTSGLSWCFKEEANLDQAANLFKYDIVKTMFDVGHAAIVITDTSDNDPTVSEEFDVSSLRVGVVVNWYPKFVDIEMYNAMNGNREVFQLPKESVAIVTNPKYDVMNNPNGVYQRLLRTMSQIDIIGENYTSGKLDVLIHLPYTLRSESNREEAKKRSKSIEAQLKGSTYGVAYIGANEQVTQMNRPVENDLLKRADMLMSIMHSQLGTPKEIFEGTADEQTMLNYYNQSINPVAEAIVQEVRRKFISRRERQGGRTFRYFRNPFGSLTIFNLAEVADKLTRNEIASSNEIRTRIGLKRSDAEGADDLRNKNLPEPEEGITEPTNNKSASIPKENDE